MRPPQPVPEALRSCSQDGHPCGAAGEVLVVESATHSKCHSSVRIFLLKSTHAGPIAPSRCRLAYKNGLRSNVSPHKSSEHSVHSVDRRCRHDQPSCFGVKGQLTNPVEICAWPFNRSTSCWLPPAWTLRMRIRSILCISRRSSNISRNRGYASSIDSLSLAPQHFA